MGLISDAASSEKIHAGSNAIPSDQSSSVSPTQRMESGHFFAANGSKEDRRTISCGLKAMLGPVEKRPFGEIIIAELNT
jgi:hypothetical protein